MQAATRKLQRKWLLDGPIVYNSKNVHVSAAGRIMMTPKILRLSGLPYGDVRAQPKTGRGNLTLTLTPLQQQQLQSITGRRFDQLELSAEELRRAIQWNSDT